MTYTLEELKQIGINAALKEKELTFEKGLPWIYNLEDGTLVHEYKNGSKILFDEVNGTLVKREVIPGV